ncbi:MAG: arginine--tRNA ligase [bacterium]
MDNKDQQSAIGKPAILRAQDEIFGFLRQAVAELVGDSVESPATKVGTLDQPPDRKLGDLCLPCFFLAKPLGRAPADIAVELAGKFRPTPLVAAAEATGPYVNFRFDRDSFSRAVLADILPSDSSYRDRPFALEVEPQNLLIEYAQPNTHKDLHVGHLRNVFLGTAAVYLLRAAGHQVAPISYINDAGAAVAKCLWAYQKYHDGEEPEGVEARGKFLGDVYAEADRRVAEDESLKEEVAQFLRSFEAGDEVAVELWRRTRQWSLDLFEKTFNELGAPIERYYYESDVVQDGRRVVDDLVKRGIARVSEGATIIDLEDVNLGVLIVLKSDGTTLYSTADLALATKKFVDYPDIDSSVYVVDVRQSLYFKQVFETMRRMGFTKQLVHLAYDFVTLKGGAMSSRKGTVIKYTDFRDEMLKLAESETRSRHADWEGERVHEIAWTLVEGAMKFTMLRQDAERPIVFDLQEALSFDGFTGPYVQYAHARLSSIQAKDGGPVMAEASVSGSFSEEEFAALRQVADLPRTIAMAVGVGSDRGFNGFNPSVLAQYAFDLAQRSNDFYRDVPVLSAEGEDRERRLAIVEAVRQSLERSLQLLGISAPREM